MALMDFLRALRPTPAVVTPVENRALAVVQQDRTEVENRVQIHPSDPQRGRFTHATFRTLADMRVNPDTSTQVAGIWACMDVIASAASSSDWNIYQGVRGVANKKALPQDSLQYILNTRFNPEMTAQAGKRAMMLAATAWGNGYAEIEWDMAGRIKALWPIHPDRVEARRDLDTGRLFYRVMQEYQGGWVDMDPSDLFIIRGASMLGFSGDNLLARAIRTVAQSLAIDQYAESYFANDAQMGTMFVYKGGKMNDVDYNRARDQLTERHVGVRRARTMGLLDGAEWDVKQFGTKMDDTALAEIKNTNLGDICRWFHVPPHKIALLVNSTNNNIEHQGLEFSRDTMRPWGQEIQQEGDYKLISVRGDPKFIELDMDWTEQGDYKSRMEAYNLGRSSGIFSANDVRRKLGENTIPAADGGDDYMVQGANVKLADVGAAYAAKAAPSPAVTAWLTSIYARVQRRQTAAGKSATAEALVQFANELIEDFPEALQAAAMRGVVGVINGIAPGIAARAALDRSPP